MDNRKNGTGKPLSSVRWLTDHHNAKLEERKKFVQKIFKNEQQTIIDLGCGPALWLELIDAEISSTSTIIGIDGDKNILDIARKKNWSSKFDFLEIDLNKETEKIPNSDVFIAFNILPYIRNIELFFEKIKEKTNEGGKIIIRQYDGSLFRFGPLDQKSRFEIDESLFSSMDGKENFNHYSLDKIFIAASKSGFENINIEFEVFNRFSPYSNDFLPYFTQSLSWTKELVSESAIQKIEQWEVKYLNSINNEASYFLEVDQIITLS